MLFIFNLSSMTSKESAKTSDGIVNSIEKLVASEKGIEPDELSEKTEDLINAVVRKTGHFLLFSVLGMLTYFLWACFFLNEKRYLLPSLFSIPVCIVFAISDEIHQMFVKGRHGRVDDVLIDVAGALAGMLASVVLVILYGKLKKCINMKKGKNDEEAI